MNDTREAVDQLLHDAQHADSGALMAGMMHDRKMVEHYEKRRAELIARAHSLDPYHVLEEWEDCDDIAAYIPAPEVPTK